MWITFKYLLQKAAIGSMVTTSTTSSSSCFSVCNCGLLSSSSMSNSLSLSSYSTFSSSSLKSGAKALQFSCLYNKQSMNIYGMRLEQDIFMQGRYYFKEKGSGGDCIKNFYKMSIMNIGKKLTTWGWAHIDTTPLEIDAIIGLTGCHYNYQK